MAGNALMATGLQSPKIDTMGAFAQGVQGAQVAEDNRITLARKGLENIGSIALGAMGGKLDGEVNPEQFEQGLGLLEQHGINVSAFRGKPQIAPIAARASLSALEQLKTAQSDRDADLALKNFQLELMKFNTPATPTPTDDQRELAQINTEREAAGKPPILMEEFLAGKSNDGMSVTLADGTTVTMGGKGNDAYEVEDAKSLVKLGNDLQEQGRAGSSAVATLGQMRKMLANDQVYTGILGEQVQALQRAGQALGLGDGVQDTETFNALSKKAALDAMGGSLGAGFSNADRSFVIEQVPNLGNTKEGNLQLIDIQEKIAQHKVKVAKFVTDYKKAHNGKLDGNFQGALAEWAEQNPVFTQTAPAGASDTAKSAGVPANAEETKELDGKTYYRVGTDWFEAD